MVQYSLNNDSRISSDHLERPNVICRACIYNATVTGALTIFTFVYRAAKRLEVVASTHNCAYRLVRIPYGLVSAL